MTTNDAPQPTKRKRPPPRRVEVLRVERLSPRMVRVTFTGDELAGFAWSGPAAHLKLFFPEEGQAEPIMPEPDGPRPMSRTYTPRRFDPAGPELEVEFVLHGHGPASSWASQVKVGQKLLLAGPGRSYPIDPEADWYLLVGDDTALPAISTILEQLPPGMPATVFLEVVDDKEIRSLKTEAEAQIRWLERGEDPRQAGMLLEEAVRGLTLPSKTGRVYVGCEANAMRRLRRYLLGPAELSKDQIVTRGYWKLDAANHPDHDYGEDGDD